MRMSDHPRPYSWETDGRAGAVDAKPEIEGRSVQPSGLFVSRETISMRQQGYGLTTFYSNVLRRRRAPATNHGIISYSYFPELVGASPVVAAGFAASAISGVEAAVGSGFFFTGPIVPRGAGLFML